MHAGGGRVAERLGVRGRRVLFLAVREQRGDNYFSVANMEIFTHIIKYYIFVLHLCIN